MKRILLVLFVIIMASLTLIACGGDDNSTTAAPSDDSTTVPPTEENTTTSPVQNTVTVTFDSNGGSAVSSQTIEKGANAEKPDDPTKEGYVFDGWYVEDEKWSFVGYVVVKDITLTAKWTPVEYNISYVLDGGTNNAGNKSSYTIEQSFTLNDPTKNGYTFDGWYSDSGFTNKITNIKQGETGDKAFFAKWDAIKYTITYELNSGTNDASNPLSFTVADTISLKSPTKSSYMFAGWYTDAECTQPITEIVNRTENVTLYAKWATNVYNIRYETNGGTNNSSNPVLYTTEQQFTLKAPSKDGYTFLGWYSDSNFTNKITEIKKGESGDKTLYAKWDIDDYTVTYVLNSGVNNASNPTSVTINDVVTLKSPSRDGYTFAGWYTDAEFTQSITEIKNNAKDLTIYAKWTLVSYTITYETYGGTNNDLNPDAYTTEESISLSDPVKTGYTFLGWYSDSSFTNKVTEIRKGEIGNKILYAKWGTDSYTVTYELNGGINNESNPLSFTVNDVITLKAPSKDGYTFNSWCTDAELTQPITEIKNEAKNLILYAKWDLVITLEKVDNKYRVTGCLADATKVIIPSSYNGLPVTSIGDSAFEGCASLISVTIPSSVTFIGDSAFSGCTSLASINVSEDNTVYKSVDGVLYSKDGKKLIAYPNDKGTSYNIPNGVTSIGNYAFYGCTSLTSVTIPSSVTSIGNYAFSGCTSITSVTIPGSVTSIGHFAFEGCASLASVTIPSSVISIGHLAFNGCTSLANINIDEGNTNYKSVDGVLYSKDGKILIAYPNSNGASYTIPDGVTTIEDSAFYGCTSLTSVTIPESVKLIKQCAFMGCTSLANITIHANQVFSAEDMCFRDCPALENIIFDGSKKTWEAKYGRYFSCEPTYVYDPSLEFGTMTYAFVVSCDPNAKSVVIPETYRGLPVTSIFGHSTVDINGNCDCMVHVSLTDLTISSNFSMNKFNSYTVDSIKTQNLIIEGNKIISASTFSYIRADNIIINESNPNYKLVDGVLYSKDGKTLIYYPSGKTNTTFTIPNGVTKIGDYAFSYCDNLENVSIPDTVTSIGDYAFRSCSVLKDIIIPSSVTQMGTSVFDNCNNMSTVCCEASTQPTGWNFNWNMYNYTYKYSTRVSAIWGVKFEKTGDSYSFAKCTQISGQRNFLSADNDKPIAIAKIPSTYKGLPVTSISRYAFTGCESVNNNIIGTYNVIIPNSIVSIGDSTFGDCISLTSVTIPSSVTSIGDNAFYGCNNLTINCEAASQPSGWANHWNLDNRPVVWGYKAN